MGDDIHEALDVQCIMRYAPWPLLYTSDWTNVLSISHSIDSFSSVQDLNTFSDYRVVVVKVRLQRGGGINKR